MASVFRLGIRRRVRRSERMRAATAAALQQYEWYITWLSATGPRQSCQTADADFLPRCHPPFSTSESAVREPLSVPGWNINMKRQHHGRVTSHLQMEGIRSEDLHHTRLERLGFLLGRSSFRADYRRISVHDCTRLSMTYALAVALSTLDSLLANIFRCRPIQFAQWGEKTFSEGHRASDSDYFYFFLCFLLRNTFSSLFFYWNLVHWHTLGFLWFFSIA